MLLYKSDDLQDVVNQEGTVIGLKRGGYRFRQRSLRQERDFAIRADDGNRPLKLKRPTRSKRL